MIGPTEGQGLAEVLNRVPMGRASLLFVVLAGLGLSLLTGRARNTGLRPLWGTVLWRASLLLVGGLSLQLLDHGVNVMPTYAMGLVLALPLLRPPGRSQQLPFRCGLLERLLRPLWTGRA